MPVIIASALRCIGFEGLNKRTLAAARIKARSALALQPLG
jgi:hypothetical protein